LSEWAIPPQGFGKSYEISPLTLINVQHRKSGGYRQRAAGSIACRALDLLFFNQRQRNLIGAGSALCGGAAMREPCPSNSVGFGWLLSVSDLTLSDPQQFFPTLR
jgi:hypothetical protein